MDILWNKWMIIQFKPYQTTNLQKWMFSPKLFFKSSMVSAAFKYVSDDLRLLFCLNPSSMIFTPFNKFSLAEQEGGKSPGLFL